MPRFLMAALAGLALTALGACNDAHRVSENLSTAADNFEVNRRIIFVNGVTNDYMLTIEGLCALGKGSETNSVTVTCKTGPGAYKKHYLGISDNVTFFAEQIDAVAASPYFYRVILKPLAILPSIEVK